MQCKDRIKAIAYLSRLVNRLTNISSEACILEKDLIDLGTDDVSDIVQKLLDAGEKVADEIEHIVKGDLPNHGSGPLDWIYTPTED